MLFSIITVVKNNIFNIEETIRSVESQNYKNYEHVIVDGFSNDGTFEKIKEIKNKNVALYRNRDKNLYESLNLAISKAKGKYIVLLHSGDLFYDQQTLTNYSKFAKNKIPCFFGSIYFYKGINKITRIWEVSEKNICIKNSYKIPHVSLVINSKILKKLVYKTSYNISADTDLIIELLKRYKNVKNIFTITHLMKEGGMSMQVQNLLSKITEDLLIYLKHFNLFFFIHYLKKITFKFMQFIQFVDFHNVKIFLSIRNILSTKPAKRNKNIFLDIINNNNFISEKKNIIFSALNLALLTYLNTLSRFYYFKYIKFWCDGHFVNLLENTSKFKKIPGRNMLLAALQNLEKSNFKYVNFVGTISTFERKKLESIIKCKNKIKITYTDPGYDKLENLLLKMKASKINTFTIMCLPTPIQEFCALAIASQSKYFKIMCAGGAVKMITGIEKALNDKFDYIFVEAIYRLRTDFVRRFKRLMYGMLFVATNYKFLKKIIVRS